MAKLEEIKELEPIISAAEGLHKGIPYGDGLDMLYQVRRSAELALEVTGNVELAKLALLHKSQNPKRTIGGATLSGEDIERLAGKDIAEIVNLLGTRPSTKNKDTDTIANEQAQWAQKMPTLAKQMLLVEKIANFETSRDRPNPSWSSEKHAEYYRTRMMVVEACKSASPELYALAVKTRDEGMQKLAVSQQEEKTSTEKSWGDRFKKTIFGKGTYVGINYFVNAISSAGIAYFFERKFESKFRSFSDSVAQKISSGQRVEKVSGGVFWAVRAFFLTLAGTLLAPVIKVLEDRRHRIEFGIGHRLDKLQAGMGMANSATLQNINDHEKIAHAMREGNTLALTAEQARRYREKHRLMQDEKGELVFKEHKLPWTKVFTARFFGWCAAIGTNFGFGYTNKNANEKLRYKYYEDKAAPWLRKNILTHIPGFNKLADPNKFSAMLFNDSLLTVSSSVMHATVQGMLHKKIDPLQEEEEMAAAAATQSPQVKARKDIVAEGPKDMRSRTEKKPGEPSPAI